MNSVTMGGNQESHSVLSSEGRHDLDENEQSRHTRDESSSDRTPITSPSAREHVFALGEILDNIFRIFSEEAQLVSEIGRQFGTFALSAKRIEDKQELAFSNPRVSDLASCIRVSKAWFNCAAPHLWSLATPWLIRRDIETLLAPVRDEDRRRFYASHITQCSIKLYAPIQAVVANDDDESDNFGTSTACAVEESAIEDSDCDSTTTTTAPLNPIFKGLAFPRLRRVLIDLDDTASDNPGYAPAKLLCLASNASVTKETQPRLEEREKEGAGPGLSGMASEAQEGATSGEDAGDGGSARERTILFRDGQKEAVVTTGAPGGADDDSHRDDREDCSVGVSEGETLEQRQSQVQVQVQAQAQAQAQARTRTRIGIQWRRTLPMELTEADFAAAMDYTSEEELKELGARNAKELIVRVRAMDGFGNRTIPSREAIERVAEVIPVRNDAFFSLSFFSSLHCCLLLN